MKKALIATLLAACFPALASQFYVVVPLPNKKVSTSAIDVALHGYSLPTGLIGTPYAGFNLNSLLSVTGDPAYTGYGVQWAVVGGSLPLGLVLNKDGSITGTPTANGTASFQVRASYKTKSGEQAYQIVVANITVGLAAGSPPQALVGQGYSYDLKPLLKVSGDNAYPGNGTGVTWSVVSNTLPAGLYLTSDGFIGGVPTAAGTGAITVRATYKGVNGEQTYQVISLKISVALSAATLPEAYVGKAFSYDLKPLLKVSGDPEFSGSDVSWSISSGTLPAGVSLTGNGVLSGTPTVASEGPVTVLATYKNAQGQQVYQVLALDLAVALGQASLPQAIVGQGYSYDLKQLLTVSGDRTYTSSSVSWNVVSSSLPAGLYLTNDGFIAGTPTAAGTGSLTARATYKTASGDQTYQIVTLNIGVTLAAGTPPEAMVGNAYRYDLKPLLTVTGDSAYPGNGTGVTWSVVSSSLPAGLYLGVDGTLAGTPTAAGTGSITVRATYKTVKGETSYQLVTLNVGVSLASASLPAGVQNAPYSYDLKQQLMVSGDLSYSNGTGVTWSVVSGSLPQGLSLNANGVISGTPTAENAGTPFTVKATYKTKSGQQGYSILVGAITVSLASVLNPPGGFVGAAYNNGQGWYLWPFLTISGDAAYTGRGDGVTWSLTSGTLPSGLSLDTATGAVSGTPTQRGSSTFTLTATYKDKSASQSYTIPVSTGLMQYSGYRAWADGSYAASCKEYRAGKPGYAYYGATGDGIYRIAVGSYAPVDVLCDMTTDGGGWTVFQRRINGAVDFYRTYAEYADGFGSATSEYWLGNDRLATLTAGGAALRVDMQRYTGQTAYAQYTSFKINPASDGYRISVGGYSGTAGDSLSNAGNAANYMRFTTKDKDNDNNSSGNCALIYHGAWWYNACHLSNLNGYYYGGKHTSYADGVEWDSWTGYYEALTKTEMKVR